MLNCYNSLRGGGGFIAIITHLRDELQGQWMQLLIMSIAVLIKYVYRIPLESIGIYQYGNSIAVVTIYVYRNSEWAPFKQEEAGSGSHVMENWRAQWWWGVTKLAGITTSVMFKWITNIILPAMYIVIPCNMIECSLKVSQHVHTLQVLFRMCFLMSWLNDTFLKVVMLQRVCPVIEGCLGEWVYIRYTCMYTLCNIYIPIGPTTQQYV